MTTAKEIPTAKQFAVETMQGTDLEEIESALIEFAKMHVEAALLKATTDAVILRVPTGKGDYSEADAQKEFIGDLGYEDYIPVKYYISQSSIINSYPLSEIK